MDEFGETPSYYIWPQGHVEGDPFPEDFEELVRKGLASVGLTYERT